MKEKYKT